MAVNIYDSPELLNLFIESKKPVYQIMQKGEDSANEYGIDRYPMIVLLDKNNIVIYSGLLDPAKITALIDKNL
jgi:protein-disulfide isomerase